MCRLFLLSYFLGVMSLAHAKEKPQVTFFSQLPNHRLAEVFTDSAVIQQLKALDASVVLAITDFHEYRAETVKLLNAWDIPVSAWLMLPRDEGYWFTVNNHPLALARYEAFKAWTERDSLSWKRVGFSIEPDLQEVDKISNADWSTWFDLLGDMMDDKSYQQAQTSYHRLADQIISDGFALETYVYPFMLEEGNKHLRKLTGLISVNSEREIPLVFSNYTHEEVDKPVFKYIQHHRLSAIGVGSSGGELHHSGIDIPKPLNYKQILHDMEIAYNLSNEIYVFSLEGCHKQGILEQLSKHQWSRKPVEPQSIPVTAQSENDHLLFNIFLQNPYWLLGIFGIILVLTCWVTLRILRRVFTS